MVKCTCGRAFKNMGKLRRHIDFFRNRPDEVLHRADREHSDTDKEFGRYYRGKKRG